MRVMTCPNRSEERNGGPRNAANAIPNPHTAAHSWTAHPTVDSLCRADCVCVCVPQCP
jgi:hypothetical protein